jgi:hypothetical protein
MKLPKYILIAQPDLFVFEFNSEGPNGSVSKLIAFTETDLPGVFNLAFGTKNLATGEIIDNVVTNNGDTEKILATVVEAVFNFTQKYPELWIYATGSTKSRTRLYRMGINRYLNEAQEHFYIFGKLNDEWVPFKKEIDFEAYLVKRKNTKFAI